MAENMATDQATDGTAVVCEANTDACTDFVEKYGCLYGWREAMSVCPKGWHLPSQDEFLALLQYVGGKSATGAQNLRVKTFGDGSDIYGFSALPAGLNSFEGYSHFGTYAYFWTSTDYGDGSAFYMYINSSTTSINYYFKVLAHSVRCVRDSN